MSDEPHVERALLSLPLLVLLTAVVADQLGYELVAQTAFWVIIGIFLFAVAVVSLLLIAFLVAAVFAT